MQPIILDANQRGKVLRLVLALGYLSFVTVLLLQSSSQPVIGAPAPPGPPSLEREILLTFGHVGVFSLLMFIFWWALAPLTSAERALQLALRFCLCYGVLSELAQVFSTNRSVSVFDAAANIGASLVTAWAISVYTNRR